MSLACEAFPKRFTFVQAMVAQKKNSNNGQVVAPVGPSKRSQKTMHTHTQKTQSECVSSIQKHSEAFRSIMIPKLLCHQVGLLMIVRFNPPEKLKNLITSIWCDYQMPTHIFLYTNHIEKKQNTSNHSQNRVAR